MGRVFEVRYEQENGWWFATLADLPSLRACGSTRAQAAVRLRSLTAQWYEVALRDVILSPAARLEA